MRKIIYCCVVLHLMVALKVQRLPELQKNHRASTIRVFASVKYCFERQDLGTATPILESIAVVCATERYLRSTVKYMTLRSLPSTWFQGKAVEMPRRVTLSCLIDASQDSWARCWNKSVPRPLKFVLLRFGGKGDNRGLGGVFVAVFCFFLRRFTASFILILMYFLTIP